jgi:hypothetical protein
MFSAAALDLPKGCRLVTKPMSREEIAELFSLNRREARSLRRRAVLTTSAQCPPTVVVRRLRGFQG